MRIKGALAIAAIALGVSAALLPLSEGSVHPGSRAGSVPAQPALFEISGHSFRAAFPETPMLESIGIYPALYKMAGSGEMPVAVVWILQIHHPVAPKTGKHVTVLTENVPTSFPDRSFRGVTIIPLLHETGHRHPAITDRSIGNLWLPSESGFERVANITEVGGATALWSGEELAVKGPWAFFVSTLAHTHASISNFLAAFQPIS